MKPQILFVLLLATTAYSFQWPTHCPKDQAVKAFRNKTIENPWPHFPNDPYKNQTDASMKVINETLSNKEIVCALKYDDNRIKSKYVLNTFGSEDEALREEYTITHQGICGACSSTQDLAVYLSMNLTSPVRKCGMKGVVSMQWAYQCIKDLGFSDQCSEIWVYNTANTRKECFSVCMWSWITNEPFNHPDGSLNSCLQCDQDKSGPVFKYYSGRTRRNSGIQSSIYRPPSTIYNMTHCYY